MNEYITVSKEDVQFKGYLDGTFSDTLRAIPVRSLNVNTDPLYTTFQLINIRFIEPPHLYVVLLKALRWDWLFLTLMPVLFICVNAKFVGINYLHLILMMCSIACFHFCVFLFNDYSDYMSDTSRVEGAYVNPVLMRGWLSARQFYRISLLFFILGVVIGLPILLVRPLILFPIVLLIVVGLIGYSFGKGLGLGELIVYLCLGPLLVTGLSVAMTGQFEIVHLFLGLFWGWLAATCLSFRQFENLMYDDQAGVNTLVRKLGFDRAKKLLCVQVFMKVIFFLGIHVYFFPYMNFIWSCIFLFITLGLGFYLLEKIISVDSSLSSGIRKLHLMSVPMSLLYGLMIMISMISIGA